MCTMLTTTITENTLIFLFFAAAHCTVDHFQALGPALIIQLRGAATMAAELSSEKHLMAHPRQPPLVSPALPTLLLWGLAVVISCHFAVTRRHEHDRSIRVIIPSLAEVAHWQILDVTISHRRLKHFFRDKCACVSSSHA
jgi:hypothetical protein